MLCAPTPSPTELEVGVSVVCCSCSLFWRCCAKRNLPCRSFIGSDGGSSPTRVDHQHALDHVHGDYWRGIHYGDHPKVPSKIQLHVCIFLKPPVERKEIRTVYRQTAEACVFALVTYRTFGPRHLATRRHAAPTHVSCFLSTVLPIRSAASCPPCRWIMHVGVVIIRWFAVEMPVGRSVGS